jgi:hypothetical protein
LVNTGMCQHEKHGKSPIRLDELVGFGEATVSVGDFVGDVSHKIFSGCVVLGVGEQHLDALYSHTAKKLASCQDGESGVFVQCVLVPVGQLQHTGSNVLEPNGVGNKMIRASLKH